MEIELGGSRFDSVCHNAYWHNVHLNTTLRVIDEDVCDDTIKHLDDCIENPTIGLVARKKTLSDDLVWRYNDNKKHLFSIPAVKDRNDVFESKFVKLYPKTGKLRKLLIEEKRVVLNDIPKKMGMLKKVAFRLVHFVKGTV